MKNSIERGNNNFEGGDNPEADEMTEQLREAAKNIEKDDKVDPLQEKSISSKTTESFINADIRKEKARLEREYNKQRTYRQGESQKQESVVEKPPQSTARKVLEGFYQVIGLTPHHRRKLKESFGVEPKEDKE